MSASPADALWRSPRLKSCVPALPAAAVEHAVAEGAVVVDGRSPESYDAGHVAGSVNVPFEDDGFEDRASCVIDPDTAVVAVGGADADPWAMAQALVRAGFRAWGILKGGVPAYNRAGCAVGLQRAITADRLLEDLRLGGAVLVDVRDDEQWVRDHVPGSLHIPLPSLAAAARYLPRTPVVVACEDGRRAGTAASVLRRGGHANIWRIAGAGMPYLLSRRLDLRGI